MGEITGTWSIGRRAAALVAELARHDSATGRHSRQVGILSRDIAGALGWADDAVQDAWIAGLVHDAGKLEVPAHLLSKPGRLTAHEWTAMSRHPEATPRVAARFGIPDDISMAAALHHEAPNGTGYPHGLQATEIPELAGVVAVADVYEALTGLRPYREPMRHADAIAHLQARVAVGTLAPEPVDALGLLVARGA